MGTTKVVEILLRRDYLEEEKLWSEWNTFLQEVCEVLQVLLLTSDSQTVTPGDEQQRNKGREEWEMEQMQSSFICT